jgi:hypothetical protein
MKCDHKWVDMEDGTNDEFCVKCSRFAKQNQSQISASFEGITIQEIAKEVDKEMRRTRLINGY